MRFGFVSLLCFILLGISFAQAKQPLTIFASHWPPFWIDDGPYKGEGILNLIGDGLQEELPQYDFRFIPSTLARTEQQIKRGQQGCNLGVLKTADRLTYYNFTEPYARIMSNGLVVPRSGLKRIQSFVDHMGYVDLAGLFRGTNILMRVPKGRKFGPDIDPILKKIEGTNQLYYLTGAGSLNLAFEAFQRNELAGTIIYPIEMMYQARQSDMEDEVVFLPIKGAVNFIAGHVACSKGEWSTQVVKDLNAALVRLRQKGKIFAALKHWLPLGVLEAHEIENAQMLTTEE